MRNFIYIQYEASGGENFVTEAMKQIKKRKRKSKNPAREEMRGAKVNDRKLIKTLKDKNDCERVELVRLHCYAAWNTPIMASQAVYRSYNQDGTVRETMGKTFYYKKGEFSFKNESGCSFKIQLERDGSVINARNEKGNQVKVCHSLKVMPLRC